ncbi:MraY family glycosyltransferase [Pararcticibacter amylolyticus]|uniref:Undecaprenyl/decaprenyl-phosphate alpha-N-acetylglucosaminyl 1-phosphate transferase n=1 Tax=Pararcticibacter amylolyticus TaxID=2173175 RepID=A0A2U2PID0_9SPHI|nr:MraY family glycosyltransferase [Pararcticibacter amylolyticus]PWG81024.1 undecaprenyl/decaprenyl-phosphate alpha-N-acetylglucosaminyl 1-phosphate transferase [Pararcticibacter amylolyticus]
MVTYLVVFIVSLLIVAFSIKPLITIAVRKRLFDVPLESRKIHKRIIPNLGGIAIFTGMLLSLALFGDILNLENANYILAAGTIIFLTGVKDDVIGVDPLKKFIAQFVAAGILVGLADLRITSLEGLLGIYELAYPLSVVLSVVLYVGVINAYNLIDGIDGLAGSLGLIASLAFAFLFYSSGEYHWAYICLALAGALCGFLMHNVSPARIFMGDCGSLMLGLMMATFAVHFINIAGKGTIETGIIPVTAAPGLALAIVLLPVFDTLRVFAIRIVHGQSPFKADKNHMHHRMLELGMNHSQATGVLAFVSALFVAMGFSLQHIGSNQLVLTLVLTIVLLNTGLSIYLYSRKVSAEKGDEQSVLRAEPQIPVVITPDLISENKDLVERALSKVAQN